MKPRDFYAVDSFATKMFGKGTELLPNVDELFELELAYLEYNCLSQEELVERSAFFKTVGGKATKHYLLYSNYDAAINENRSAQTQAYFSEGQFSTGYATHGLFPYRGKFHPQLVKALLNIMGVDKGDVVLDPMAGSGTTNVEAALLGIDSVAIDISPFCQFMIKTKYESLLIDKATLNRASINTQKLFDYFQKGDVFNRIKKIKDEQRRKIYALAFLAWLDALGYSKRVLRSTHEQLYEKVLARYVETVKSILNNPYFEQKKLGNVKIADDSSATKIDLPDASVDCVITSPPYSFAIDYAENDKTQLEFLGCDVTALKERLIGLHGKNKTEKLQNYFSDMDRVCAEIARVLKPKKYFCMIIGSNTNQTGGIRLEQTIIDSCAKYAMPLVKSIVKPIRGMRNTMKNEYVLIFKRGDYENG